jgi:hypothetical protein
MKRANYRHQYHDSHPAALQLREDPCRRVVIHLRPSEPDASTEKLGKGQWSYSASIILPVATASLQLRMLRAVKVAVTERIREVLEQLARQGVAQQERGG